MCLLVATVLILVELWGWGGAVGEVLLFVAWRAQCWWIMWTGCWVPCMVDAVQMEWWTIVLKSWKKYENWNLSVMGLLWAVTSRQHWRNWCGTERLCHWNFYVWTALAKQDIHYQILYKTWRGWIVWVEAYIWSYYYKQLQSRCDLNDEQ